MMPWEQSLDTFILIFSVGRGNAAFVRTGMNQGFVVDMGCPEDGFDPSNFIENEFCPKLSKYDGKGIAQVVLSHPHKDHILQCKRLADGGGLSPKLVTCPHDKEPENGGIREQLNWKRIKNPDGTDELRRSYQSLYEHRSLPLQTIKHTDKAAVPPELEYGIYYIRPPKCEVLHATDDNKYGNATSIVFYLRYGQNSILFPGDMTPEGMQHLLREAEGSEKRYTVFDRKHSAEHPEWSTKTCDQWSLQWLLKNRGLSVLVAPHHGLESCYSPDLYSAIRGGKPQLVVISEKRLLSENDGSTHKNYQCELGASGLDVEKDKVIEKCCRSLSTKDGRHVLIVFTGRGVPRVYANSDPGYLLKVMDGKAASAAARRFI